MFAVLAVLLLQPVPPATAAVPALLDEQPPELATAAFEALFFARDTPSSYNQRNPDRYSVNSNDNPSGSNVEVRVVQSLLHGASLLRSLARSNLRLPDG